MNIRGSRVARSLVVWTVLGALVWLDHRGPRVGQHAAIFAFIVQVLVWVGDALITVGTYVAVTLEVFVQYIWTMLGWLTRRVADILTNTGAMFARVWESARAFYDNVLRPALVWLHDFYNTVRDWLTKVMAPILRWAQRVKDELQSLYKRFVRPVLDALDTTRKVLDILTKLHVPFARQLDTWVTQVEQTITENYLKLLGLVNTTIDTLNGILTLDGFFQRFVFLRTLERDAFYVWRVMVNTRSRPLSGDEQHRITRAAFVYGPPEIIDQTAAWWKGQPGDFSDGMNVDVATNTAFWNQAA